MGYIELWGIAIGLILAMILYLGFIVWINCDKVY